MTGIVRTTVGFAGDSRSAPDAGSDLTEAIKIEYDPDHVSFEDLLGSFFEQHTPQEGVETKLKSAIWYHSEDQRALADYACKSRGMSAASVDIAPAQHWQDAEDHHQKYLEKQRSPQMAKLHMGRC